MRVNAFQLVIITYFTIVAAVVASFILLKPSHGYPLWALVVYGISTVVFVLIGAMLVFAAYGIRHGAPPEYEIGLRGIHRV